jgi:hypothetical protein
MRRKDAARGWFANITLVASGHLNDDAKTIWRHASAGRNVLFH